MKININSKTNLSLILTVVFLGVLVFEGFLIYKYIYLNLYAPEAVIDQESVVRVDLPKYQATVELLERLHNYQPGFIDMPRSNPFR